MASLAVRAVRAVTARGAIVVVARTLASPAAATRKDPFAALNIDEEGNCEDLETALRLVKCFAGGRTNETVDIALRVNMDPRRSTLRGTAKLPVSFGKQEVVAVFARGAKADEAREAGAAIVGAEELVSMIEKDNITFTKCLATPDMMPLVQSVSRKLGPKGLMPNAKRGSVTNDLKQAIADLSGPIVDYRIDKEAIVHAGIAHVSLTNEAIIANVHAFVKAVFDAKPTLNKKGRLLLSASLASTQGKGVPLNVNCIDPNVRENWDRKMKLRAV